jgi:hypothetical protein
MFREDVIKIMQEELSLSIKPINSSTVKVCLKIAGEELKSDYVLSARRGGGDSIMLELAKKNNTKRR